MAQRAVNPYLLSLGIRRLDAVLVSHLDNDHVGGLHDVLQSFEVGKVISSEALPASPFHVCKAGEQWQWDGVTLRFLHPDYPGDFDKRNNRSCVLLIEAAGRRLLLPGDAEAEVEDRFAASVPALDVLVAGHHGSKTSSTMAVAKQVKNGVVIFSSGYLSRFGHPHPGVEQRFHQLNTKSWVTALAGMVSISIDLTGAMSVVGWRESQGKYWQHITRRDNHVR
jgi:competence protein ComEC